MTDHAQQYRLTQEADQRRLEELTNRDPQDLSDVAGELGLARFLAERCALSNPSLCSNILGSIAKLALAAERHAQATNELLARPALRAFMQEMIAVVCEEVQKLPNADVIIDNIARRLDAAYVNAKNEPDKAPTLLLTHERLP